MTSHPDRPRLVRLPRERADCPRPFDEQTALPLARAIERRAARLGTLRGLEIALANPI